MSGTIALVGGDEFRAGCENMDREIMQASGKHPASVVIIPTAAVTGPEKAANDGVTHFTALGAAATRLMVLEPSQANDNALIQPVTNADVVYFTGGSPDHLLAVLRSNGGPGSTLLRLLTQGLERGLVLGGSSAGAMVMGSVMRRPPLYPAHNPAQDEKNRWVDGLGIAPGVCVLPHHERRDPAETLSELRRSAPAGVVYLGIDARTGVIGRPGQWQVAGFGNVTVYQGADFAVFGAGQQLPAGF